MSTRLQDLRAKTTLIPEQVTNAYFQKTGLTCTGCEKVPRTLVSSRCQEILAKEPVVFLRDKLFQDRRMRLYNHIHLELKCAQSCFCSPREIFQEDAILSQLSSLKGNQFCVIFAVLFSCNFLKKVTCDFYERILIKASTHCTLHSMMTLIYLLISFH